MADNDRFVIVKLSDFDRVVSGYLVSIKESDKQIKPRAEYESIVLKAIDFELNKILNGESNITNIQVAKAVCDALFGKSK